MTLTSLPDLIVEVAFDDDPGAGTTWTDITSRVRDGSIRRGRTDERSEYQTGVLNLTLDNRDRALDPFNASSTYAGKLLPRKDIRVRATWNSTTYNLFYGQIAGWPVTPSPNNDTVSVIEAYDALGQLADVKMPPDAWTYWLRDNAAYYSGKMTVWLPLGGTGQVIQDIRYATPPRNFTFTTATPKTESAPSDFMSGNATTFDGTYGAIGPAVPMNTGYLSGGYVSFWVKTTEAGPTGGQNPILATAGSTSIARIGVNDAGQLEFIYDGFNLNSGFPINDGNWHHVVVNHFNDPGFGDEAAYIYVDGILLGFDSTGATASIAGWALIGMRNPSTTGDAAFFTGALAQITCYNDNTNVLADNYADWGHQAGRNGILVNSQGPLTTDYLIAEIAGWSLVNWGNEDWETGTVRIQALRWGGSALDLIQQATFAEYGRTFVSGTGDLNFLNRSHEFTGTRGTTAQATYSDSGSAGTVKYSSIGQLVYSDEYLATEVQVTAGDGNTILLDSTGYVSYGYRSERYELPLTLTDATEWAATFLSRYDHPTFRVKEWTVIPQRDPSTAFPKVLDARLGDRVILEIKPSNVGTRISENMIVEQITHTFTPETWETTFSGSPALNAWLLEDATYGLLGSTTVLG